MQRTTFSFDCVRVFVAPTGEYTIALADDDHPVALSSVHTEPDALVAMSMQYASYGRGHIPGGYQGAVLAYFGPEAAGLAVGGMQTRLTRYEAARLGDMLGRAACYIIRESTKEQR